MVQPQPENLPFPSTRTTTTATAESSNGAAVDAMDDGKLPTIKTQDHAMDGSNSTIRQKANPLESESKGTTGGAASSATTNPKKRKMVLAASQAATSFSGSISDNKTSLAASSVITASQLRHGDYKSRSRRNRHRSSASASASVAAMPCPGPPNFHGTNTMPQYSPGMAMTPQYSPGMAMTKQFHPPNIRRTGMTSQLLQHPPSFRVMTESTIPKQPRKVAVPTITPSASASATHASPAVSTSNVAPAPDGTLPPSLRSAATLGLFGASSFVSDPLTGDETSGFSPPPAVAPSLSKSDRNLQPSTSGAPILISPSTQDAARLGAVSGSALHGDSALTPTRRTDPSQARGSFGHTNQHQSLLSQPLPLAPRATSSTFSSDNSKPPKRKNALPKTSTEHVVNATRSGPKSHITNKRQRSENIPSPSTMTTPMGNGASTMDTMHPSHEMSLLCTRRCFGMVLVILLRRWH